MSSTLRDIADAIANALGSVTFNSVTEPPTVVSANLATYTAEEMKDPVIVVTPGSLTVTRVSRTTHQYDCAVFIYVGRQASTEEAYDEMLNLSEEVIDELRAHTWGEDITFPGGATAPTSIEIDINPDDALQERNIWRCVITPRYTLFRND